MPVSLSLESPKLSPSAPSHRGTSVAGVDDATPLGKASRTPGITVVGFSCQNLLHDIGLFNAREPEVEACMAVCQFAMIESHQLQHCGM